MEKKRDLWIRSWKSLIFVILPLTDIFHRVCKKIKVFFFMIRRKKIKIQFWAKFIWMCKLCHYRGQCSLSQSLIKLLIRYRSLLPLSPHPHILGRPFAPLFQGQETCFQTRSKGVAFRRTSSSLLPC